MSIEREMPGRTGGLASEREQHWGPCCCTWARIKVSLTSPDRRHNCDGIWEVCFLRISVDLSRFEKIKKY